MQPVLRPPVEWLRHAAAGICEHEKLLHLFRVGLQKLQEEVQDLLPAEWLPVPAWQLKALWQ